MFFIVVSPFGFGFSLSLISVYHTDLDNFLTDIRIFQKVFYFFVQPRVFGVFLFFASVLGLSTTAVSKYELNESYPPLVTLRAIAALLNVSLDYLAGMEKRELISAYNLTDHQHDIINKLIATFRERNIKTNKKLSPEGYMLLGEILEELGK